MTTERKEYEMTEEDLSRLLEASRPVPYIVVGRIPPRSPRENAEAAWRALGEKMGFDGMTARPIPGRSQRWFTAIPTTQEEKR